MSKCILMRKEKDKATFNSPSEVWCLPAQSFTKPEEREFVVDSGASMRAQSKKDLNSAELDTAQVWRFDAHAEQDLNSAEVETVRVSRNPTTVVTANGQVQTNEDATVYVYDVDLFVTAQMLEDTPAVPSLGWILL